MRAGRRDEAFGVLQQQLNAASPARHLARTCACFGDEEHAVEYLEKSAADDQSGPGVLLQAPELASMHANTRVAALRGRLNLQ